MEGDSDDGAPLSKKRGKGPETSSEDESEPKPRKKVRIGHGRMTATKPATTQEGRKERKRGGLKSPPCNSCADRRRECYECIGASACYHCSLMKNRCSLVPLKQKASKNRSGRSNRTDDDEENISSEEEMEHPNVRRGMFFFFFYMICC